jgi:hypothetical protein
LAAASALLVSAYYAFGGLLPVELGKANLLIVLACMGLTSLLALLSFILLCPEYRKFAREALMRFKRRPVDGS